MARNNYRLIITFMILGSAAFYILILGDSGYLERRELVGKRNVIEQKIVELRQEQGELGVIRERSQSGAPGALELYHAGLVRKGSKVLIFKGQEEGKEAVRGGVQSGKGSSSLLWFRVAWILLSAGMVGVMIYLGRREHGETP